jgi:hypothetical protein
MTGGFYDHRRSKLKLISTIREGTKFINSKYDELEGIRASLQDILFANAIELSDHKNGRLLEFFVNSYICCPNSKCAYPCLFQILDSQ